MHMWTLNILLVLPASCRKLKKEERVERAEDCWLLWGMVGFWDHASRRGLQPTLPCVFHWLRHWDALLSRQTLSAFFCSLQRGLRTYRAKGHVLYQLACPWGLAYACMVIAASFICLLHGEPPFAVDVWVLLSATRGDCQQPKGGKCGTCGTGTRGSELCSICSPDMGAQRTNFCCEP